MATDNSIDFWFSIGSTYTYLTVMRLPEIERKTGVTFRWRPFSVRTIMREMENVPFSTKPIKAAYMWRDIERRAAAYGLPVQVPAPYPLDGFDLANRVAVLGAREGWCADYARATYKRWFQQGLPAGSEPNLSQSLAEIGQDPQRVVAAANSDEIADAYEAATNEARSLNLFGAPSFVVGEEVFWGDDRLDDAISWLKHGRVKVSQTQFTGGPGEHVDTETRELYASSNGDRWYLARQVESQQVYVRHVANAPSGAQVSRIDLATFLRLDGNAPEQQALLRLIGTLTKGHSDADDS